MVTTYSTEAQPALNTVPARRVDGSVWTARLRRFRATVALAGQANGDDVVLFRVPAGSVFAYGVLNPSATLGTATIAIGVAGTTNRYKNAATLTAANVPTLFGKTAEVSGAGLAADTDVLLTVGAAALPGAGTLVVDMYFSNG